MCAGEFMRAAAGGLFPGGFGGVQLWCVAFGEWLPLVVKIVV
ncbi:hypothetical protein [Phytoactinopolyspora mesophila]|nr:hypothetical protein [Phytoactinopolyspora mesophila]